MGGGRWVEQKGRCCCNTKSLSKCYYPMSTATTQATLPFAGPGLRPSELDLGLTILPYLISPSQVGLNPYRVIEQGGFAWFIQVSYRIEMWRILVFSDSVAMSLPVFDVIQPLWASCTGIWPRGSQNCFQSFLPFILCRLEQEIPGKAIGKQTFSGAYYEIWFFSD